MIEYFQLGMSYMLETNNMEDDYKFMNEAVKEAKKSLNTGGIPIGAILVKDGRIMGRGHNSLFQKNSNILHAEMDCIENTGRLTGEEYKKCTLYTTLSPCEMCSGAIMLYKIPRVVMGENENLKGPENCLIQAGVELENLDLSECKELLGNYIQQNPDLWNSEIERIQK
jgi:cytosine/creatinine deaminase